MAPIKKSLKRKAIEEESDIENEVSSEGEQALDSKISEDSEDELDDLDDEDDEESSDDDEEVEGEAEKDSEGQDIKRRKMGEDGKPTSREQHAEQKKLLKERKIRRHAGIDIQKIKALWEKLRVRNPPIAKPVRDKLCDEIWELSQNGIKDLVLKHDSSRVVQTLVKYSSKERRELITKELKDYFYELARSAYGKYLLIKLLHYGTKESRELIVLEFHGKLKKLLKHREGAYVIEDLFVLYSSNKQKKQMIREFWGAKYAVFKDDSDKTVVEVVQGNEDARNLIARNLNQSITSSVDKGSTGFQILHAVMKEYIKIASDSEFEELIELLQDQIAELVHTPDGCDVACTLIAKASAKQRKAIVKNLKQHTKKLITNEHGNLVLLTIFLTVDDTKMVHKAFSVDDSAEFAEYMSHKFARRPFLYLLCGLDGKYFNPGVLKSLRHYVELSSKTSKKEQDIRKAELLEKYTDGFYKGLIDHHHTVFQENIGIQFASEVIVHAPKGFDDDRKKVIDIAYGLVFKPEFLAKPFASRFLRVCIQGGHWNFSDKSVVKDNDQFIGVEFAHRIVENIDDLSEWLDNKDKSFVIVALFETLKSEDDKDSQKFVKGVVKHKKVLKKIGEENKGAKLLLKLIESN